MADRRIGSGVNKTGMARMKVATAVVSVVAFLGSMGIITATSPATAQNTNTGNTVQVASAVTSGSTATQSNSRALTLTAPQRTSSLAPLTRTRGS